MLQTRTQAEDITFGDPIFGDAGLPADQLLPVGDAVGQRRAANDPPRVVVSGWQIYDNKGRVVEKYEPFFSTGFAYALPTKTEFGQKAMMFYDPRGQVIRTVNSDGSEQRVIFGVPADLANPDHFISTPWEAFTYDANDNAGRTHHDDALGYKHHWNTPASIMIDALGRTVTAIARNGSNPDTERFVTRSTYDIQGNLLTVTDALGRVAFKHVYDLGKHPLRVENIDAGIRRTVLDAIGNPMEGRDSKGALVLHAYEILNRPVRLWARDGSGQPLSLRERIVYGDTPDPGLTLVQAAAANLLGKPYKHYDEAGLLTFEAYDFKGNVLEKTRQVISDAAILSVFDPPPLDWQVQAFRVDWQPASGTTLETHANGLLDVTPYRTSVTYDALNRVKTMRYPQDVNGEHKELRPRYNRAGALERVELDGTLFVEHIAYNAKRQRTLITYGNGVMTRYAYDPQTFRLTRLRTERYTKPDPLTYHPTGTPLQDFAYKYDLAGNITAIHDRTPESGIPNTSLGVNALDRAFTYDPIYRLLSASGRECDLPMDYFTTRRTGDIQRRLEGIRRVREFIVQHGVSGLAAVVQLSAVLVLMFVYNPVLTLAFLATAPLYVMLMRFSARWLRPIFDTLEEGFGKYHSYQIDAIKGIETVKAMGAEGTFREMMLNQFRGITRCQFQADFTVMCYEGTIHSVTFLSLITFLWVGALQLLQGALTIGGFVAFNSLVALANASIWTLLSLWDNLQFSSVLLNRLHDVFEQEPEQGADHSHLLSVRTLEGRVRFHNVGFQYGGPESPKILDGITFEVPPGKVVAIVGRSGSGKTTLIKCLAGLLEPTEGTILYDGVDLKTLNYRDLRRQIGFVLQENYLFADTIARNIAFGEDEPAIDRVLWAARVANAHEFIERFPLGYDTRVGETGILLSGGQRQRIAIARALYHRPPILIFDEATSNLDTESEKAIQENLDKLLQGRTSFVIAHRLSTIRDADLIVVLEKGRLVEQGTHDELMNRQGLYYYLCSQQLGL